jgi:hypothetical protein
MRRLVKRLEVQSKNPDPLLDFRQTTHLRAMIEKHIPQGQAQTHKKSSALCDFRYGLHIPSAPSKKSGS